MEPFRIEPRPFHRSAHSPTLKSQVPSHLLLRQLNFNNKARVNLTNLCKSSNLFDNIPHFFPFRLSNNRFVTLLQPSSQPYPLRVSTYNSITLEYVYRVSKLLERHFAFNHPLSGSINFSSPTVKTAYVSAYTVIASWKQSWRLYTPIRRSRRWKPYIINSSQIVSYYECCKVNCEEGENAS